MKNLLSILAFCLMAPNAHAEALTITCTTYHRDTLAPIVIYATTYRTGALLEGDAVLRVGIKGSDLASQTKYASYSKSEVTGFYTSEKLLLIKVNKLVDPNLAELDLQYNWRTRAGTAIVRQANGVKIGSGSINCEMR